MLFVIVMLGGTLQSADKLKCLDMKLMGIAVIDYHKLRTGGVILVVML